MSDFQEVQDRHFATADEAHYRWATEDPAFAPVEDALIAQALDGVRFPCLEIGCGEGTNLARLVRRGRAVGVDRHPEKLRFAASAVPAARVVAADALALPFGDGAFTGVLVRDLLHHVSDPRRAAAEAVRVLAPGGTLVVLEPNGKNPIVALQARLVPAESSLRRFGPASVLGALSGLPLTAPRVDMVQGLPLRRLVLHYRFGWPALGRSRAGAALLARLEDVGARLLPRERWSYALVRSERV